MWASVVNQLDGWLAPTVLVITAMVFQPLRILLMSLVFRLIGVPKAKIADWALKHANQDKFINILKVLRPPPLPPPPTNSSTSKPDDSSRPRAIR
jgi:hypothetical protein